MFFFVALGTFLLGHFYVNHKMCKKKRPYFIFFVKYRFTIDMTH